MNYNNVKNPFDIYEENNPQSNEPNNIESQKSGNVNADNENNRAKNIVSYILYGIMVMLSIIGVICLVLPTVRNTLFSTFLGV